MKLRWLVALTLSLLGCAHAPAPVTTPTPTPPSGLGAPAWERLKRELPGTWTMPGKNGPFVVAYKLISGQSALVEAWGAGTPHETETVFYPDHADLWLTHYCAQGNQPRLRVSRVSEDAVVFTFVDVTNRSPDQAMLVERTLRIGQDALEDTEVYRGSDGREERTTYRFVRTGTP